MTIYNFFLKSISLFLKLDQSEFIDPNISFIELKNKILDINDNKLHECFYYEEKLYGYVQKTFINLEESYLAFEIANVRNALYLFAQKNNDLIMTCKLAVNEYISIINSKCNWDSFFIEKRDLEYNKDNKPDKWNVVLCPSIVATGELKLKTFFSLNTNSFMIDILRLGEDFTGNDIVSLISDSYLFDEHMKYILSEKISELLRFYICSHFIVIK